MRKLDMHWISSEGGALVLVPENRLALWQGCLGPCDTNTDYDRTRKISEYLGTLPLADGSSVVVLGGSPMQTTVVEHGLRTPHSQLLVRWNYADDEQSVITALDGVDRLRFGEGLTVYIDGRAILFDAAEQGTRPLGRRLAIELSSGIYRIRTAVCSPTPRLGLVLHRLEPQSE